MHCPPSSFDLYHARNNGNAGYHVGDKCNTTCNKPEDNNPNNGDFDKNTPGAGEGMMKYYSGSFLQIEWTAQHGCGTCGDGRSCGAHARARACVEEGPWRDVLCGPCPKNTYEVRVV